MPRPAALALVLALTTMLAAQPRPVDISASRVTVRVFRAGIFGAFGDDHEIAAPLAAGTLDDSARQVTLRFDARQMRVLDPKLSLDKRTEVQQRMLGPEVLDVEHFPEITFQSTAVRPDGANQMAVTGDLRLHGQVHPVRGTATNSAGMYRGTFHFRQQAFGIKPVSVAGGTVKVKDEVVIEFEIRLAAAR